MRKTIRWILAILLLPILLFVVSAALLYVPFIQKWVVKEAATYVSKQTGFGVTFQKLAVSFPLDIEVNRLLVEQDGDEILSVKKAIVDLDFSQILHKELGIDAITLKSGEVDTRNLIEQLTLQGKLGQLRLSGNAVKFPQQCARLNDARIDGCQLNIVLHDTTINDTVSENSFPWHFYVKQLHVANSQVALHLPGDSIVLDGRIQKAHIKRADVNLAEKLYQIRFCSLEADSLHYDCPYSPNLSINAMDYNHLALRNITVGLSDIRFLQEPMTLQANIDRFSFSEKCGFYLRELRTSARIDSTTIRLNDLLAETDYSKIEGNVKLDWANFATQIQDNFNITDDCFDIELKTSVGREDILFAAGSFLPNDVRSLLPPQPILFDMQGQGSTFAANAIVQEGRGKAQLSGNVDLASMTYDASLATNRFCISKYLQTDSTLYVSANAKMKGKGTDFLSKRSQLFVQAKVNELAYGNRACGGIDLSARLLHGKAYVEMNSQNDFVRGNACVEASVDKVIQDASFSLDLNSIDLHALQLTEKPLSASMVMHLDGNTNLKDTHNLQGSIMAMELCTADSTYHPLDLEVMTALSPTGTLAQAKAGDMEATFTSEQPLDSILSRIEILTAELSKEMSAYSIYQDTLRTMLPQLEFNLLCGKNNPVSNMFRYATGYSMNDVHFELKSSPAEGLNGKGYAHTLNTGAILLDTIQWDVIQDGAGLNMNARIKNGKRNKVASFETFFHSSLTTNGARAKLDFIDAKGNKGVELGMQLEMMEEGIRAHFAPLDPIIAYRQFSLNEDNFIQLSPNGRLEALVDLLADDGTGLKLYSIPNEDAQQDLSLSMNNVNLGELTSALPYLPDIKGMLNGDLHYVQQDSTLSVSADIVARKMEHKNTLVGDIGLNGVYLPNMDGSHYIDGIITQNGREVIFMNGKYHEQEGKGWIDADATVERLPLSIANGYVTDNLAELKGYVNGELTISGQTSNPMVNGQLATDSVHIVSVPYSLNLRLPDKNIQIANNYIELDGIEAFAAGNSPMTLNGSIDFAQLDNILLNMNVKAHNYQLINAPKKRQALAYGRVYVDIDGWIKGTLDNLNIGGWLNVLGNTDVTYVLTDSPITVEDQLADLVTFADFSDTISVEDDVPLQKAQHVRLNMQLSIEQAAQVHCILSSDGSDYIELEGGGTLSLTYDEQNQMRLYGRYTILNGVMKYTLVAIPLKDFTIEHGSYVEFKGDIMNPTLNISATERVKAAVSENKVSRNVAFDVGLALSQTLDNMGLRFTLEAPEDMSIQNELAAMSEEDRGRVAVTMLVTGMYITDANNMAGGFSYANTLNTYLQSAINNITNKALGTIDLNFGIENSTTATGSTTTDYSFSFAKRFWGNRISVIVGGKVSTGQDAVNNGQTIIDNVSLEYRLDKSATRYVRVYYDRNYESLLEGELTEMGAGVVFRRKTDRLGELFLFKKNRTK